MTRETGTHNAAIALGTSGLKGLSAVYYNLGAAELYEETLRRGEAQLTAQGALVARTGQHTGRSPKDKFVVRDASTEDHIWWDNNAPMSPEAFELLYADFMEQAQGKELFVQDLIGGADADYSLNTRVITEFAWHSLFIRNLLIRPERETLTSFVPQMTIIDLPSFRADPARHGTRTETVIAVDLKAPDRADRRLRLCGRNEEICVYGAELHPAGEGRYAYALLGQ